MEADNVRSITLRVAIFFGLTTFTLCIGIFYIESILDDTRNQVEEKDLIIKTLQADVEDQQILLDEADMKINELKGQVGLQPIESTQIQVAE